MLNNAEMIEIKRRAIERSRHGEKYRMERLDRTWAVSRKKKKPAAKNFS